MGWRYRRSIKLLPGFRLNLGSRGVTSLSVGGRGMTVNVGKRGTKTTYSIPGTGISYQTKTAAYRSPASQSVMPQALPHSSASFASPRRGMMVAYALVGVAALAGYLTLRPGDTAPQHAPGASIPAAPTSAPAAAALPALVPPAIAQEIVGVASAPAALPELQRAVTATGANVRATPSMAGSIIKVLTAGMPVQIMASEGAWRRLADSDGHPGGWVHSSVLK